MTALMYAAQNGSLGIMKLLVDGGADWKRENRVSNIDRLERTFFLFDTLSIRVEELV